MKTIALAVLVLFTACGKKAANPEVDRYINQDIAPHLAKVGAARAGYDDIKVTYIENAANLPNLTHRLTDAAVPLLTQAAEGLGKVTPPASVQVLHDDLIRIVKAELAAISEMSAALDPVDEAKFAAGHAAMMEIQSRVFSWDKQLEAVLRRDAIKMNELPDVDVPKPRAVAPAPADVVTPE